MVEEANASGDGTSHVMGRIEVEPGGCTVRTAERVYHLTRKRANFLPRSLVTRKFGKPSRERRQMTAGFGLAGALSCAAKTGTYILE
jgi:hypothetical protein